MDIKRDELLQLYSIAIDEYRFNVQLNWDRTKYYLALNAGILGAGAGLFTAEHSFESATLLGAVFVIGVLTSILGAKATKLGHEYYRRANYKKTLIESELGFLEPVPAYAADKHATVAIATTKGMREAEKILTAPEEYFKESLRGDSIIRRLYLLLCGFAWLNALGIVLVVAEAWLRR